MITIKKNLKFIIFSISIITLFAIGSIIFTNKIVRNSNIKKTDVKILVTNNYKSIDNPSVYNLIRNLSNISNYLNVIQYKQETLLNKINNSAFHTIQKHAAIKHKYINHANSFINDGNKSLKKENKLIVEILSILKNHPGTYQYYLAKYRYTIPNLNFFVNYNYINKVKTNNIKNYSYKVSNYVNLNSISYASEEAVFGTKEISKTNSAIIDAASKDYEFKANIISYNFKTNSFDFINSTKTNNNNKNKFVTNNPQQSNLISLNNNNIKVNGHNNQLDNIFSTNNKPTNINTYNNICFKTHLNIWNAKSFNKNQTTYILFPFLSGIVLNLVIIGIGGGIQKIINIKEKSRLKIQNIRVSEISSDDEPLRTAKYYNKIRNNRYSNWKKNGNNNDGPSNIITTVVESHEGEQNGCILNSGSLHRIREAKENKFNIKLNEHMTTLPITESLDVSDIDGSTTISRKITIYSKENKNTIPINIMGENNHMLKMDRDTKRRLIYSSPEIITTNMICVSDVTGDNIRGKEVHLIRLSPRNGTEDKAEDGSIVIKYVNVTGLIHRENVNEYVLHAPVEGCSLKLEIIKGTEIW